ncbi:MAG: hypothetical protein RL385_5480, partial [Pseudomonadota bacterium]
MQAAITHPTHWRPLLRCGTAVLALCATLSGPSTAKTQELLVPWYAYPAAPSAQEDQWAILAQSASTARFTAIINPADGPGRGGPNADYQRGLQLLSASGAALLGYVTTRLPGVALRPIADVKADVDEWTRSFSAYPVQGIFLDGTSSDAADIGYFEELYRYIHTNPRYLRVVLNPGTPPAQAYYQRATAELIVSFEGNAGTWSSHVPPSYMSGFGPARFGALVYGAASVASMRSAMALARGRGFGTVYVTSDDLPNPWDTLPSYWNTEQLAARAAVVPVPGMSALALVLCALGLCTLGIIGAVRRTRRTRT